MRTEHMTPWVAVVSLPLGSPAGEKYVGDGRDLLLQGFHWASHAGAHDHHGRRSWYRILQENAATIKAAGFTWIWMPPSSDSLAPQGYIPRRWYSLDTPY